MYMIIPNCQYLDALETQKNKILIRDIKDMFN